MDRFSGIKVFLRVAETGSFSAVARELGVTQPTVSKQIGALERYLGARLLNRSTRHVALSEEGARYYEHCRNILEAMDRAEASVGQAAQPSGALRVSCPVSFAQAQLAPRVRGFLDRYPDIRVDLRMSDIFVDLIEEGADVAIRIGALNDSALIARKIGMTRRVTVASPDYLGVAGAPASPADLVSHDCIVFTRLATGSRWHFEGPGGDESVTVSGQLRASNATAVREAVVSGIGLSVLPLWLVADEVGSGALVVVMERYRPRPLPLHLLFPARSYVPARVRCFADFIADSLSQRGLARQRGCAVPARCVAKGRWKAENQARLFTSC